jgi:phosphatidylinositol-3-phosphatase
MRKGIRGVMAIAMLVPMFAAPAGHAALPPIRHVFTIVLENQESAVTFGIGQALWPYLARTLPLQGAFVPNYYGIGHNSLDNYIAMISGQSPNPATQDDCEDPSTMGDNGNFSIGAYGQAIGVGCTYPPQIESIATQLTDRGYTWKGYMEDMDARPGVKRTTCQGPYTKNLIESPVPPGNPKTPDDYRAKHNPFVYFHSIFDDLAYCDARDVPLTGLAADLASETTTPNFSFIVPNQCNDAHDFPNCSDGSMGGLQRANDWLKIWIPRIKASPAYKHDGLIIVTFDEALFPSACCGEKKGPNLGPKRNNGGSYGPLTPLAPGGGVTGAIFISKYIAKHTVSLRSYNHYSYLRSMENLFGLPHLGYAAQTGLRPFGKDIYSAG